jgi:hypothetical protein
MRGLPTLKAHLPFGALDQNECQYKCIGKLIVVVLVLNAAAHHLLRSLAMISIGMDDGARDL